MGNVLPICIITVISLGTIFKGLINFLCINIQDQYTCFELTFDVVKTQDPITLLTDSLDFFKSKKKILGQFILSEVNNHFYGICIIIPSISPIMLRKWCTIRKIYN